MNRFLLTLAVVVLAGSLPIPSEEKPARKGLAPLMQAEQTERLLLNEPPDAIARVQAME